MSDLAASDVAYTEVAGSAKASPADPRRSGIFTLVFGDGALTYPAGGIPLTGGKLGCPSNIDELYIVDSGTSGFQVKYDATNKKIRLFNPTGAHAHDLLVKGGQAAAGTDAVSIKTATLGKEAATDRTALGSASATSGGVLSSAATVGAELGNVAFAAVTIKVKAVGY